MNSIVRFFKNKNTVTVLGVIIIVAIIWFVYNYQLQKTVKPQQVPVAATTIQPRTKITADMIKYVDVPQSYISDNAITTQEEIVNKYANYNTMIPAGSMFYEETVVNEQIMPNYIQTQLKEGEIGVAYTINIAENTIGWGIMPGAKIDLYMRVTTDEGSVMLGKLLENVEVLAVTDDNGNNVYEVTDGSRTPTKLVFGVKEDIFLLLLRSNYLNIELFPIQHGAWVDDKDATTKLTTQELIDYIKARTVQLSTDPVNSTIEQVR
jgi:Flp pilus assembly protein CpaB